MADGPEGPLRTRLRNEGAALLTPAQAHQEATELMRLAARAQALGPRRIQRRQGRLDLTLSLLTDPDAEATLAAVIMTILQDRDPALTGLMGAGAATDQQVIQALQAETDTSDETARPAVEGIAMALAAHVPEGRQQARPADPVPHRRRLDVRLASARNKAQQTRDQAVIKHLEAALMSVGLAQQEGRSSLVDALEKALLLRP